MINTSRARTWKTTALRKYTCWREAHPHAIFASETSLLVGATTDVCQLPLRRMCGPPLLLRRSSSTVPLHQQFSFSLDSLKTTTSIFKSIVFVSIKSLLPVCSLESVTPFVLCRRAWRVSRRQTLTASCLNSTSSFSDRLHPHLHSGPHEEDDNKTIVEIIRQCLVRDVKLVKPQLDFGEQLSTLVQYPNKFSPPDCFAPFPLEPPSAAMESSSCGWSAGFPSVVLRAIEDTGAVIMTDLASFVRQICPFRFRLNLWMQRLESSSFSWPSDFPSAVF